MNKRGLKVNENLDEMKIFSSTMDGLDRVRREQYAFHCDALTAFPIIHDIFDPYEICNLNTVRQHNKSPANIFIKTFIQDSISTENHSWICYKDKISISLNIFHEVCKK